MQGNYNDAVAERGVSTPGTFIRPTGVLVAVCFATDPVERWSFLKFIYVFLQGSVCRDGQAPLLAQGRYVIRCLGRDGELPLLEIAEPLHGILACYGNFIAG